jgi:2-keto-3-deoxy-L-fuconate dehydrogenase
MSSRLSGKTAFVTAAAQGIGRATVEAFAREGARVIAADINNAALTDLVRAVDCRPLVLDVTSARQVTDAARTHGPVDVLFNGAGFVHAGTILDCDDDAFEFSLNSNVRSMYRTIRAALPGMLARGGGSIINVASVREPEGPAIASSTAPGSGDRADQVGRSRLHHSTSAATRFVLAQWTRHRFGTSRSRPKSGLSEHGAINFVSRQPMGRIGRPGDRRAGRLPRQTVGVHDRRGRGDRRRLDQLVGSAPRPRIRGLLRINAEVRASRCGSAARLCQDDGIDGVRARYQRAGMTR